MSTQISTQHQDGYAVLTLTGDFDLANSDRLNEALRAELVDGQARHLLLELSGVTFMDSTALGVIVRARNLVDGVERRLAVAGASKAVARLMQITQVDRVVPLYLDVPSAMADGHVADN
jgi:anti-sigma B factor antagonist